MVSLAWPWGLLSLVAVAAAALLALRRPLHRIVPVSSLKLWKRAVESAAPAAARRPRRVSGAWALLLAWAAAAGVALAQPMWRRQRPIRRMTLAVYPSAELGEAGADSLAGSAEALLGRLSADDRVRLALPALLGGMAEPLPPDQALAQIRRVRLLPVRAADLAVPADGSFGPLIRLAPAVLSLPEGPDAHTIALPAFPADVTVDAFGAEKPPGRDAEVFVAVRNHSASPHSQVVAIRSDTSPPVRRTVELPANGRAGVSADVPPGEVISAVLEGAAGPASGAYAVRRVVSPRTVAMVGRDDPLLRRFIEVDPRLILIGEAGRADIVVAVGAAPPTGKPALVIDPPDPPPGWGRGPVRENLSLADAAASPNSPLTAHVDLAAVAVRGAGTWRRAEPTVAAPVLTMGQDALIVATDTPARVYVSFDLAAANTNFGLDSSFVIFLANVFARLAGAAPGAVSRYEWQSPLQAGTEPGWTRISPGPSRPGPLPWPGLYRDAEGRPHAVNLVGLRSARPDVSPVDAAAHVPLPPPQCARREVPLWPVLALFAMAAWLVGWAVRTR